MLNVLKLREDTPHADELIHFNNAGSSLSPQSVSEAVLNHLVLEQKIGGYEAAEAKSQDMEAFYHHAAKLIGAHSEEIAYVEGATHAWHRAFGSIPFAPGDEIITGRSEYGSNFMSFLHLQKTLDIRIHLIEDDEHGDMDLEALEKKISSRTALIALTHIPTSNGIVNNAIEVGKIAKAHDVLYLLDACQSVGQMQVDVESIACDFLSTTGRKFLRGPRGTGFLYVRKGIQDKLRPSFINMLTSDWTSEMGYQLGRNARAFEVWERSVAGHLGLSEAMRYANVLGMEHIETRIQALGETLKKSMQSVPGLNLLNKGRHQSGIMTFDMDGFNSDDIRVRLQAQKINISTCSVQHGRLDMQHRGLKKLARASLHYYNTESEIESFTQALRQLK